MKFADFDPTVWTNKDLDNLSNLWSEYETVIKNLKEVNFKMKDQIMTNEALKSEIETSTKRCNEITKNESHVSIESAKEIVELSKNIKNIRKQEDELERKIVNYKNQMEELREKRDLLEKNISTLNEKVNQRKIDNIPISGKVKVLPFKNIENKLETNSDKSAIITTENFAVLPLKNIYSEFIDSLEDIDDELREKIDETDFINTIDSKDENDMLMNEIKERKNNYNEAIKAIELSDITTKELESKQEFNIELMSSREKEAKNDTEKEITDQSDKVEITVDESPEEKEEDVNLFKDESENEKIESETKPVEEETAISDPKPENKEETENTQNIQNDEEIKTNEENETVPIKNDTVIPITDNKEEEKIEQDSVIPINMDQNKEETVIPIISEEKEEPIKVEEPKEEKTEFDKINVKSNLIANAKSERLSVINSIYSKNEELEGIKPVNKNNIVIGFTLDSRLESVKKYTDNNKKVVNTDRANSNVGNIFGSSNVQSNESDSVRLVKAA